MTRKTAFLVAGAGCLLVAGVTVAGLVGAGLLYSVTRNSAGSGREARRGWATGRVLGRDGKPLAIPGQTIRVQLIGPNVRGERAVLTPPVDADGRYKQKLEYASDGIEYAIGAVVTFPRDGKEWKLELYPTDARNDSVRFRGEDGIVRDFMVKLEGRVPGPLERRYGGDAPVFANTSEHYGFGGGSNLRLIPVGTVFTFTLTPRGVLIDGLPGGTLTRVLTRRVDGGSMKLEDVSPGAYTVSCDARLPDGTTLRPFLGTHDGSPARYGRSIGIEFGPTSSRPYTELALVDDTEPDALTPPQG